MGNQKFKFLDMIPNSCFFKLKQMTKSQYSSEGSLHPNPTPKPLLPLTPNRASNYYPSFKSPEMLPIDPPRKSKRRIRAKPIDKSVTSSASSIHSDGYSPTDEEGHLHHSDMGSEAADFSIRSKSCVTVSELELRPIVIDKVRRNKGKSKISPSGLHRMRVSSSPRVACKKLQKGRQSSGSPGRERRGLSESFAVVKSSLDPQKDFRESMVEMIVEKNLRKSKELEELLVWYLMLNSTECHEVIVKVFEKIWFELAEIMTL